MDEYSFESTFMQQIVLRLFIKFGILSSQVHGKRVKVVWITSVQICDILRLQTTVSLKPLSALCVYLLDLYLFCKIFIWSRILDRMNSNKRK